MRVAAQQIGLLVDLPDLRAVPGFGLAERLQRAAERFLRLGVLGEAPRDAVLEPQQPLDALRRRDIAADAARRALRRSAGLVLRLRHPLPPAPLYYSRWAIEFA